MWPLSRDEVPGTDGDGAGATEGTFYVQDMRQNLKIGQIGPFLTMKRQERMCVHVPVCDWILSAYTHAELLRKSQE